MRTTAILTAVFSFLVVNGCSSSPDAKSIVNKSIAFHGMEKLSNANVSFTFRQYRYRVSQQNGNYRYERYFTDSTGNKIHDALTNTGFTREVDNIAVKLSSKETAAYTEAVNAVVYFTYLPFKLNDAAVQKKFLGKVTINNKEFYKVEVSFSKDQGGKDHQDIYYYWFDTADYSMDHLAYSTGGKRFRAVLHAHLVNGVRFQDYLNYEHPPGDTLTPLIRYDSLYQARKLKELSRIEMKDIRIIDNE